MKHILGKRVERIDGYEKVTGKALFGDDLKFPGMLYAACRHTDIPVGKITKLDIAQAEKIDGVEAIARHEHIPGETRVGPIRADCYPIVKNEVFSSF